MAEREIAAGKSEYAYYSVGLSLLYVEQIMSLAADRMDKFVLPPPP
jgi:hypothetical protein